jgi:hypothetical protein
LNGDDAGMTQIGMFDNVQVVASSITEGAGLDGLTGQVYGVTRPSVTQVEVFGGAPEDHAFSIHFKNGRTIWMNPELLVFVDHAPGTTMTIGDKTRIRNADGGWDEKQGG